MKEEYFYDGRMGVEADNMTPSDAIHIPKALQGGTAPTKCEFKGCQELTIFWMCGPHQAEADRKLGEYLIKNGWTKVFGGADESSGNTTRSSTEADSMGTPCRARPSEDRCGDDREQSN